MFVDVSKLLDGKPLGFQNLTVNFGENILEHLGFRITKAVINLNLERVNNCISASGKLKYSAAGPCYKCGSPADIEETVEFNDFFTTEPNENYDAYQFSGRNIDVDDFAKNLILFNFPASALCQSNCKGRCGRCGRNLNEGLCKCSSETSGLINPANPLNKLKEIKRR